MTKLAERNPTPEEVEEVKSLVEEAKRLRLEMKRQTGLSEMDLIAGHQASHCLKLARIQDALIALADWAQGIDERLHLLTEHLGVEFRTTSVTAPADDNPTEPVH